MGVRTLAATEWRGIRARLTNLGTYLPLSARDRAFPARLFRASFIGRASAHAGAVRLTIRRPQDEGCIHGEDCGGNRGSSGGGTPGADAAGLTRRPRPADSSPGE